MDLKWDHGALSYGSRVYGSSWVCHQGSKAESRGAQGCLPFLDVRENMGEGVNLGVTKRAEEAILLAPNPSKDHEMQVRIFEYRRQSQLGPARLG